jgi:hypothetical protein
MKQIFTDEVLPELQKVGSGFIQNHYFRTACIPETKLAQRLEDIENTMQPGIKLAYLPSGGEVKLRLTGRSSNLSELNNQMAAIASKIRHTLGSDVYAEADIPLAAVVAGLLKEKDFYLIADDASIKGVLQRKFREAAAFPEMTSGPLPDRNGFRIYFQPETGSSSFSVEWEFLESGLCRKSGKISVPAFSQEEVFRNMLALRALDMLRRQLQDS